MTSNTTGFSSSKSLDFKTCSKIDDYDRISKSDGNHGSSSPDSPNFLRWTENLNELLNDSVGLDLFQEYLKQEDQDRYHMLKFWLACKGLHKQPKDRLTDCIKAIYSHLFLKIGLGFSSEMSKSVAHQILMAGMNKTPLSASVFDEASKIAYDVMKNVMYPCFLNSEVYLNYAQKMQVQVQFSDPGNNGDDTPACTYDELPRNYKKSLEVVEEDKELNFDALSIGKSESFRQLLQPIPSNSSRMSKNSITRLHYNSFNPISRQDSESHSLSSGRTDSQTDLTHLSEDLNATTDTGKTYIEQRREHHRQRHRSKRAQSENTPFINNMVNMPMMYPVRPRTFDLEVRNKKKPVDPQKFVVELVSKLENIKKEQECGGLVRRKINSIAYDEEECGAIAGQSISDCALSRMDDDDQDILDEHVKRIWNDRTPGKSPFFASPPLPKSPVTRRASTAYFGSSEKQKHADNCSSHTIHVCPSYGGVDRKKDKDAYSLFSIDSGNGTDRTDFSDLSRRSSCRQKSTSEYSIHSDSFSSANSGLCSQYDRDLWIGSQKTISDSGVSMISKSMINYVAGTSSSSKDRIIPWQNVRRFPPSGKSPLDLKEDVDASVMMSKRKSKPAASPIKSKGASTFNNPSLPGQPFLADPNMPPFSFYKINARDTLDETKRRLQNLPCVQQQLSGESTVLTSVVYNFSDESLPYLLKIPGDQVTLKMFKDHMPPRKGSFRYFFVTMCEEFDNKPVYEEIHDDSCILPLWKGKIMSQIKANK